MKLHGTIRPGKLDQTCADRLEPGRECNITRIFGNVDADTVDFDQTCLGGRTRVFGSVAPTCSYPSACSLVYAPAADGEDFFRVNQLQTTWVPGTPEVTVAGDVVAAHTLTLDGQAGTD